MKFSHIGLVVVLVAAIITGAVVYASTGDDSKSAPSSKTGGNAAQTVDTAPVPVGGTITVGAEQEPPCFDWIGSCANSTWGTWIAELQTVPMAFRVVPSGAPNSGELKAVPGAVLAAAPTLETTPVEKITYPINKDAVWNDGIPITCDDFKYTVDQEQNDSDVYDNTGYGDIDTVTCPDPKTAVVTYKAGKTYVNWQQLFSGSAGIMPSHILKGHKRDDLMKNGYSWSGGPWIATWTKGDNVTLTQNANFWGPKPKLDKVVFKFMSDTATEFQALKSGQLDAIAPAPQIDVVDAITAGGLTDINTAYSSNTASVEALYINNEKAPLNDKTVRQALAYAVDRKGLVDRLFGKLGVSTPSNSLNPYAFRDYSDQDAFSKYGLNLDMVNQLMTGAGWAKGTDGVWAKDGKRASFTTSTTAGDKRRELTERVLQEQLKAAGFELKINDMKPDDLFSKLPTGDFDMVVLANTQTALTPGLCSILCSQNIPTEANGQSGNNITRTNIKELDPLLEKVDSSLDNNERMAAAKQADDITADYMVSLPMDPLPDILLWNKKVKGPIQTNSIEGMFWNIDEWGVLH